MINSSKVTHLWVANASANILSGVTAALVSLALPAIMVKYLPSIEFSVWVLSLQVIAYISLLNLNLQNATATAVSRCDANAQNVSFSIAEVVAASRTIAYFASFAAMAAVAAIAYFYPLLFPKVPSIYEPEFRALVAIFGFAAIFQILAQPDIGVFQGRHRNIYFVSVQVLVRLVSVMAVWLSVNAGQPMVAVAAVFASATSFVWPLMRIVFRWSYGARLIIKEKRTSTSIWRDLLSNCASLSVLSISMLLVNSAGLLAVSQFDILAVGPYSLGMTAATVITGLIGAILAPLITTGAALNSTEVSRQKLPKLLMHSSWTANSALNVLVLVLILFNESLLSVWIGPEQAHNAAPVVVAIVAAHCLRNITAPYALLLIATGMHRRAMLGSVIEASMNIVASVILGHYFGVLGVAFGSLLASGLGVALILALNVSATPELTPKPAAFVFNTVLIPLAVFAPLHFIAIGVYI